MSDWYDCIEPEVRKAVRLLRNAGLNTTCSCGHDMSIDGAPAVDGELQQIHNVLFNNGLYPYHVEFHLYVDADGLQNALWRVMFREDKEADDDEAREEGCQVCQATGEGRQEVSRHIGTGDGGDGI